MCQCLLPLKLRTNIIINSIRQRDDKVFKRFYNELYEELVVYAYRYLYDQSFSEDIVQEVFIFIWENANKIEITTSLKAYVYRMVRNRCINYLKSLKVTDETGILDEDFVYEPFPELDSLFSSQKEELYGAVLIIVDTLPEKMQEIFRLKYLDNFQYKEIADQLGISENTVKTQLRRAKTRIKNSLIMILVMIFLTGF